MLFGHKYEFYFISLDVTKFEDQSGTEMFKTVILLCFIPTEL